jgi:myo-inositol-1-phosphate synthase
LAETVNIAVVGVGNCASSLVQGLSYYARSDSQPGLMSAQIGPYRAADVRVIAAFDVSADKVGSDLAEAIRQQPNSTFGFAEVPATGVIVSRGPSLDGISETCRSSITESAQPAADVASHLRDSGAEVVISYLPVGSDQATYHYADAAITAGCAFVNCMPTPLARTAEWSRQFQEAGLPVIGDDIKSQVGATIMHRVLAKLCQDRGIGIDRTYQLNVGGNMDFLNMHEPRRGRSKEESKIRSVNSLLKADLPEIQLAASVAYVPGLGDRKTAHIRLEGHGFGGAPITIDVKLDVWDSPNSAGVAIDAVRYAKCARDKGMAGPVVPACAYLMKSPPAEMAEDTAREELLAF